VGLIDDHRGDVDGGARGNEVPEQRRGLFVRQHEDVRGGGERGCRWCGRSRSSGDRDADWCEKLRQVCRCRGRQRGEWDYQQHDPPLPARVPRGAGAGGREKAVQRYHCGDERFAARRARGDNQVAATREYTR
jgi:hypothetical protein